MSKRRGRKIILQITLVVLAIFLVRAWQHQDLAHGQAPSIIATAINGQKITIGEAADEPTLVRFFAVWCRICGWENGHIDDIADDYRIVHIAIESGDDEALRKYANENHLDADNIINDRFGVLANRFGVKGTPTSFIVNRAGKIEFIEVGYTTELGFRLRLWWAGRS